MENWNELLKKIIESMGFADFKVEVDEEHRHAKIFIYDNPGLIKENLPVLVESFNHLFQLIAQKNNREAIFVDINNYRKEREVIIIELAKAAARKALATKQTISLPAMNSYERRLIHVELAGRPDVMTESEGNGHERYVTVRLVDISKAQPKSSVE